MPLEYQALKCVQCNAFQAKQVTKQQKFSCSMCGFKQTIQRVFAISSSAKDIRLHVQKLNMARGEKEQEQQAQLDAAWDRYDQREDTFAEENDENDAQGVSQNHVQANQCTAAWDQYAEEAEKEELEHAMAYGDDGPDKSHFVTALADLKGRARGKMKGVGATDNSAGRKTQKSRHQEIGAQENSINRPSTSYVLQGFQKRTRFGGYQAADKQPWHSSSGNTHTSHMNKVDNTVASLQAVRASGWQPQKKPCIEPTTDTSQIEQGYATQFQPRGQQPHQPTLYGRYHEQPNSGLQHSAYALTPSQSQNHPQQQQQQNHQQRQNASNETTYTAPIVNVAWNHHPGSHNEQRNGVQTGSGFACKPKAVTPVVNSKWSSFAAGDDEHEQLGGDEGDDAGFVTAW